MKDEPQGVITCPLTQRHCRRVNCADSCQDLEKRRQAACSPIKPSPFEPWLPLEQRCVIIKQSAPPPATNSLTS